MTIFQKQDQDHEEQQKQQQEQHQRSCDKKKKEVICTTTNKNKNKNKNKYNRNNNSNGIILFEEKTYVGDVDDDNVRVEVEEVGLQQAEAEEVTEDVVGLVEVETEVPLHIAVRQCWPKLFPTKSSSKKYIRKGLFTVASLCETKVVEEKVAAENTYYQKGKCDTKIKIGDIIRRKIQKGEQQQKQQKGGGQDAVQQHFRNRGTSTSEILQRAIGGKLCIAYIDQYIAVVVKPYGMPVNKVNVNVQIQRSTHQQQQQQQKVISLHELLLHCMPQTQQTQTPHSRTHQLRKHMEYIGHPIVGDRKYKDLNKNGIHNNNNSKSKSKRRIDKISSDDDNGGIISYLKEVEEEAVSASALSSIVDDVDVAVNIASASGSGGGGATAAASASASASDYHVFAKDSETYIDRSKGTLKVKIDMPIEMKQLLLRSLEN
ncbi:hypothetical protein FRACYDRAFT_258275 [Fragilariopsis cylindrus CCMP1102]|uniref:Pseudouridine synthase RsuA/RluA-like domain-containing protein n=1 Tax=Fragilariopsis cylindrus CCMP1102 TaxID=635003 RepID=A0A1E7EIS0_9STRA|nr:hypothetical protein FRACYDRAFT_258275 [Fragilariopsis cylindrus CCMP1102]|eukprot:OEU05788.1 hypothetical protein FRACYDRAFT_258275 [Fragilariopsis cylindrus CCMP1102]